MRLFQSCIILFALLSALAASPFVLAQSDYGLNEAVEQASYLEKFAGQDTLEGAYGALIKVALGFLGIAFFGLILYGGFKWMLARGNSEQIDQAKEVISGASIGLILVGAAYAIARAVFSALQSGTF